MERYGVNKWVTLVVVLFSALIFASASCTVSQVVKAVSGDIVVPDDYATIQAAVNAAQSGDRIYVKTGVYPENLVVNKPISLIGEDIDGTRIIGNWDQNYLRPITITCSGVTVTGFSIVDSWAGICIDQASYCTISGNKIINNHYGIMLTSASDNTITENIIESAKSGACGIELTDASNNVIKANQITAIAAGVAIEDTALFPIQAITSQNNSILNNTVTHCSGAAVSFRLTKENVLAGNTISNSAIGLSLGWTENNTVYHNNFVDNGEQVPGGPEPTWWASNEIYYSTCDWDNGKEGNFWSNYTGIDANQDGIGDTPHVINEKNTDNFPLMNPFTGQEITSTSIDLQSSIDSATPSPPPTPTATPPNPEPFPTGQAVAIFCSVMVATVGLFWFFKKSIRKT